MMATRLLAVVVATLWLAVPAAAQDAPADIQDAAQYYLDACRDTAETPNPTPRLITEVQLNEDSRPDYVIDTGQTGCTGFCGSAGCLIHVFLSRQAGGAQSAAEENVQSWELSERAGHPVLAVNLHGSACGKPGFESCPSVMSFVGGRYNLTPE